MDDWPENRVSDGRWHRITLDYYDNVGYKKAISTWSFNFADLFIKPLQRKLCKIKYPLFLDDFRNWSYHWMIVMLISQWSLVILPVIRSVLLRSPQSYRKSSSILQIPPNFAGKTQSEKCAHLFHTNKYRKIKQVKNLHELFIMLKFHSLLDC